MNMGPKLGKTCFIPCSHEFLIDETGKIAINDDLGCRFFFIVLVQRELGRFLSQKCDNLAQYHSCQGKLEDGSHCFSNFFSETFPTI